MIKKFERGGRSGKREYSKPGGRGPRKFGGGGFRRPGPRAGGDFGGDRKLHQATCSVCGAECQVPFRPDGSRPIYCRDCFRKHGGEAGGGDQFRREERGPRRPFPARRESHAPPREQDAGLARMMEKINDKLDRILEALDAGGEEEE